MTSQSPFLDSQISQQKSTNTSFVQQTTEVPLQTATKVVVIGDLHIKNDNYSETMELGNRLISIVGEIRPDLIVILGDTLHSFDIAHVVPHKTSVMLCRELKRIAKVCFLIGNHDLPSPTSYLTDDHFFTAMYEWTDFIVVDRCCRVFEINSHKFAAVPYIPEGRFEDALFTNTDYVEEEITAIFAHQQFVGCKMDTIISKTGDSWGEDKPLVISGHIHEYQRMGKNIVYVGTPRQSSFRDSIDKTISLFTFSEDKTWNETRIPIGLPIKVKITISAYEVPTWIPPEGHKIKLVIRGTPSEIATAREHSNIQHWKNIGISIIYSDIIEIMSPVQIEMPNNFVSFTTLYRKKIENNPIYVKLYTEIIENVGFLH